MTERRLTTINSLTNEYHDDVANLGEELVDQNPKEAIKIIDSLTTKLRHLKQNLKNDEI